MLCNPEVLAILCPFTVEVLQKLDAVNSITSAVDTCEVLYFNINWFYILILIDFILSPNY